MNFISVQNLYYSVLTADTDSALTYGAMKKIPGLVKLSIDASSQDASFYGDSQKLEQISILSDIKVQIEASQLSLEQIAELLGHTYDEVKGTVIASQHDVAPYIGIAFERTRADGTKRFTKLYKMRFSIPKDDASTSSNQVSFQDQTLEATALPLTKNGNWKMYLEETDTNASDIASFYTAMVTA